MIICQRNWLKITLIAKFEIVMTIEYFFLKQIFDPCRGSVTLWKEQESSYLKLIIVLA